MLDDPDYCRESPDEEEDEEGEADETPPEEENEKVDDDEDDDEDGSSDGDQEASQRIFVARFMNNIVKPQVQHALDRRGREVSTRATSCPVLAS